MKDDEQTGLPRHDPRERAVAPDPLGFIGGLVAGAMCSAAGSTTWLWALGVMLINLIPTLSTVMQPSRPLLNFDRILGEAPQIGTLWIFLVALLVSTLPVGIALTMRDEPESITMRNGLFLGWILGFIAIPIVVVQSLSETLSRTGGGA